MRWLAELDGAEPANLRTKMNQKDLRHWKRNHPGHRSFTVLRHPVARAHDAFCRHILPVGKGAYVQLRKTMIRRYDMPLPPDGPTASYNIGAHRAAFMAFLKFLKGNLSGQTAIRVDAAWCTQAQAIAGFGDLCLPDRLIREADLTEELPSLATTVGKSDAPDVPPIPDDHPFSLAETYTSEIEDLCRAAYQRDYMMFGFSSWR